MLRNACNQINGFELLHCTCAITLYYWTKLKPIELPK